MDLRVVTYNVHKCVGIDNRYRPARIAEVLQEVDADIIALQEVLSLEGGSPEDDQARFIADKLGYHYTLGENRQIDGGAYGNVALSRFPLRTVCNHDLTVRGYERRGCLHIDVSVTPSDQVHVFNVHLGTAFMERRHQGRRLTSRSILQNDELKGPKIVLGDFNEWTRGLATRLLGTHLKSVDISKHLGRRKTYPGVFPFMHLDHIYFDGPLELQHLTLHRSRKAVMASDHLPLVANFTFSPRHAAPEARLT
jgi:endonuclease/exonuclease/phosphatase family metal-dependent hydrolase